MIMTPAVRTASRISCWVQPQYFAQARSSAELWMSTSRRLGLACLTDTAPPLSANTLPAYTLNSLPPHMCSSEHKFEAVQDGCTLSEVADGEGPNDSRRIAL